MIILSTRPLPCRKVSSPGYGASSHTVRYPSIQNLAFTRHIPGAAKRAAAAAAADTGPGTNDAPSQALATEPALATSGVHSNAPLEALIADVLNAHKTQLQRPSDLLSLIDASGHGLTTTVRRSWDTTAVSLTLQGAWVGGAEARKMAMLAVYQECQVARAAALLRLLRWLAQQQPSLLDDVAVQQVEAAAAAGDINPAVQLLMVPQLTLMAAALYPWPVLMRLVEGAVAAATQALFAKPPYSYSPSKQKAAQQQLQWVEASLCRGAALARLRALLLQQGRLQHWQQQADAAAAAAGGSSLQGLTGEQAYHEWWKQQQQQQRQQQQGIFGGAIGAANAGRPLLVSFHARGARSTSGSSTAAGKGSSGSSSGNEWLLQGAPGVAATAAAAGGDWEVAAVAAEQQALCASISRLTEQVRVLKQQMGSTEAALGVLPEVQSAHRTALLALLVSWADASPATWGPPPGPTAAARVAITSIEHDKLFRRIALEASGPEVRVLRQLAKTKGPGFLAHFSPSVGNPFGNVPEWDYFRECPGVFARFVVDPATDTATLTFKHLAAGHHHHHHHHHQQQQQKGTPAGSSASLSGPQLQQLQQQLLLVLSGNTPAANSTGSGVQLCPVGSTAAVATDNSSSSSTVNGRGQSGLELLLDGSAVAVLQPGHVASLVTVLDDLGRQVPEHYSTANMAAAVQVTPAPPWKQALQGSLSLLRSGLKAAAAAALLALPLIAMARPFRQHQQQQSQPPLMTTPTAAEGAGGGAATTAAAAAAAAGTAAGMLLNDRLTQQQLLSLCTAVQQRVDGRLWLSSSEAGIDDATAASILAGSNGSSTGGSSGGSNAGSSGGSSGGLMFQVVVDGSGAVLGLSPCSAAAAAVLWELPLAVNLQGQRLEQIQQRRAAAVAAVLSRPSAAKQPKAAPSSSSSQLGYRPVVQQPLPQDGVAVLRLLLTPTTLQQQQQQQEASVGTTASMGPDAAAISSPSHQAANVALGPHEQQQQQEAPAVSQQQQQQDVCVVGSGKAAATMWRMSASVTPWTDDDSLTVWANKGAVFQDQLLLQQQQQQQAVMPGAAGSSSSPASLQGAAVAGGGLETQVSGAGGAKVQQLSLTVDGQEVDSMKAFVQQLIALQQQQQQ